MKAIQVNAYEVPTELPLVDIETPEPQSHEVLLKVEAVGVNYADIMMSQGLYPGGPKPPYIPGLEAAGTVVKLGDKVQGVQVGQRVAAITNGGAYAEYTTALPSLLVPLPQETTFEMGAAFSVVFLTAYHCLHTCAALQAGETVLIHAAAGGVGTAAVQLAKLAEATVLTTASSDEKLKQVKALGADVCINYQTQDFEAVVQQHTDGRGVEVVLESVGGEVFEKSQRCLASWGRLVVLGIAGGMPGALEATDLLFHNKSVIGFHLGQLAAMRPELMAPAVKTLMAHWQAGELCPLVGKIYPLSQTVQAWEWIRQRHNVGKVVLRP